jgi:hypothetical protein
MCLNYGEIKIQWLSAKSTTINRCHPKADASTEAVMIPDNDKINGEKN